MLAAAPVNAACRAVRPRSLPFRDPLPAHELLEARDLARAPEHDERVACLQPVVGGRGGVEVALLGAEGKDDGPGALADAELADGAAGDGGVVGHGELLQAKLYALLPAGYYVEKVDDEGLGGE